MGRVNYNFYRVILIISIIIYVPACMGLGNPKKVGILLWSHDVKSYVETLRGIYAGLYDSGFRRGHNIEIFLEDAEGDEVKAREIAASFVKKKFDAIVVIGSAALIAAQDATKDTATPIIYTVVNFPKKAGLIDDWPSSGRNVTGIYVNISTRVYLKRLKMIIPQTKQLGVLYTQAYPTSTAQAQQFELLAPKYGIEAKLLVPTGNEISEPATYLKTIRPSIDALFIVEDPAIYSGNTLETIIGICESIKLPVIVTSDEELKFGALFSLGANYYQVGRQTVPFISKVLEGIEPKDIPNEKPYEIKFTINKTALDRLGIPLTWNLIIEADAILE